LTSSAALWRWSVKYGIVAIGTLDGIEDGEILIRDLNVRNVDVLKSLHGFLEL
jgi:hypothetical protein